MLVQELITNRNLIIHSQSADGEIKQWDDSGFYKERKPKHDDMQKRTGFSEFHWKIINCVHENQPIGLDTIPDLIQENYSSVSSALRYLRNKSVIERRGKKYYAGVDDPHDEKFIPMKRKIYLFSKTVGKFQPSDVHHICKNPSGHLLALKNEGKLRHFPAEKKYMWVGG